jgi:hypothetical protein
VAGRPCRLVDHWISSHVRLLPAVHELKLSGTSDI